MVLIILIEPVPFRNTNHTRKHKTNHMTDASDLETIRQELYELRLLYKKIAEQHIPTEEPTPEDIEALESEDETVGEEEVLNALKQPP